MKEAGRYSKMDWLPWQSYPFVTLESKFFLNPISISRSQNLISESEYRFSSSQRQRIFQTLHGVSPTHLVFPLCWQQHWQQEII